MKLKFMRKRNKSKAIHKIKRKITQLLSEHKHGNGIQEHKNL